MWVETGALPDNTWEQLQEALEWAIEPTRAKYLYVRQHFIPGRLREMVNALFWAIRGYLSCPFPQGQLQHHLDVMFHLVQDILRPYYVGIRTEMVAANYRVRTIQKFWWESYMNPAYQVCQRRLRRDFEEFTQALEERAV